MEKRNVQVLDRAIDILEELAHSREPLGLSELARKTEISKTTVHRILQTLLERGYVEQNLEGAYDIGPKMFNILSYHINSLELQAEAKPYLSSLQRAVELSVYLGVMDGPFVSIIERETLDPSDEFFTQLGHRYPAHSSSMGKCLLACLSSDELEEVLYGVELKESTPHTITDKKEFIKHLHQVRRQGYATDIEESELDHRCLAAPIYNYRGDAIAVIGVSGTNARMPAEKIDYVAQEVVRTAQHISSAMGYKE